MKKCTDAADWQDVSFRIWNLGSSYVNTAFHKSISCEDFEVNTHSLQSGLVNLNRSKKLEMKIK